MNRKKMQIFVSSTYSDLRAERQAAVEAILTSGHIPAGMELFVAGDEAQWDTIKHWIEESDAFMLILGARYGSIEPKSGSSYIQLEYEYAIERKKPLFSAVMSEEYRKQRVKADGEDVLERKSPEKYEAFRAAVLQRMCRSFNSPNDVKLIVHESLPVLIRDREMIGWVRGDQVADVMPILRDNEELRREIAALKTQMTKAEVKHVESQPYNGFGFEAVKKALSDETLTIPGKVLGEGHRDKTYTVLQLLGAWADELNIGVSNLLSSSEFHHWIFFNIAPKLAIWGLVERSALPGNAMRFQMSKLGQQFLARLKMSHQRIAQNKTVASARREPSQYGAITPFGPRAGGGFGTSGSPPPYLRGICGHNP